MDTIITRAMLDPVRNVARGVYYVRRNGGGGGVRGGGLRNSGIDLLKVGLPTMSADARIEQPRYSRIARTFKAPHQIKIIIRASCINDAPNDALSANGIQCIPYKDDNTLHIQDSSQDKG